MRRTFKFISSFLIAVMVLSFTAIAVSALNYTTKADSLNEMGLLKGTGNGYELDRSAMRVEAAVMLVRLLGKEPEVMTGTYHHPFKDVPLWANKYIGYLYENGLTKGTSATTFDPSVLCDTHMYTVFVLRALGYTEDNGSFTYTQAKQYAVDMGLIDESEANAESFKRDDVVAISYSALFQKPKGAANTTLLDKLAGANAVKAETASKYLSYYNIYKEFQTASAGSTITAPIVIEQQINTEIIAEGTAFNTSSDSMITIVKNGTSYIMQDETVRSFMGTTSTTTSYYADGWLYANSADSKTKVRVDFNTIESALEVTTIEVPYYSVNSMSKSTTASGTTYTIGYLADALNSTLGVTLSLTGSNTGDASIKANSITETVTFGTDGKLKSAAVNASMDITTTDGGQVESYTMNLRYVQSVVKTDNSITVTLPSDLNSYAD